MANRLSSDVHLGAVKAETLEYVAAHPDASREEVLAHLEEAGFGSTRYPVQRWRKEVAAAAAEEAAADAEPEPAPKKSAAVSSFAEMSDEDLAAHLLAKPTLADRLWAPERGVPDRDPGEKRDAYIRRVLLGVVAE